MHWLYGVKMKFDGAVKKNYGKKEENEKEKEKWCEICYVCFFYIEIIPLSMSIVMW